MSNPDQAPGYDGEPTYAQDEYNEYLRWREETEPQTWKACWGQPLKSSNLLSSAIVISRLHSANPQRPSSARYPTWSRRRVR
jgi:hypothetical protein